MEGEKTGSAHNAPPKRKRLSTYEQSVKTKVVMATKWASAAHLIKPFPPKRHRAFMRVKFHGAISQAPPK